MGKPDQSESEGASCFQDDLRADARRNVRSILEAAARVLAGDPAASVQAIADEAEVSRPTVYRHFANRKELIDAIRLEAMSQAMETFDAAATSKEPAAAALERLVLDLADIVNRYPLLAVLIGNDQKPKDGKPPERIISTFKALIARGKRDGTLRPGLRAEVLGPVTMGGLILSLKVGTQKGRAPSRIGAEVAALVLEGVRPETGLKAR